MRAAVIALVLVLAWPASAVIINRTDQLMWACDGTNGLDGVVYCVGYLAGFNDLNALVPALTRDRRRAFCPPTSGVSGDQLRLVFIDWAKRHPKELHTSARSSVVLALQDAFPCELPR